MCVVLCQPYHRRNLVAMICRLGDCFVALAVIITLRTIIPVKGQPTLHGCGYGDPSNNLAAEQNGEEIRSLKAEVQSMRELLTESFQQMKSRQASALRRLDVAIQLLLYHDISIKNQTGNSWKLEIGKVNYVSSIDKHAMHLHSLIKSSLI